MQGTLLETTGQRMLEELYTFNLFLAALPSNLQVGHPKLIRLSACPVIMMNIDLSPLSSLVSSGERISFLFRV